MALSIIPQAGLVIIRHRHSAAEREMTRAIVLAEMLAEADTRPKGRTGLVAQDDEGRTTVVMVIVQTGRQPSLMRWKVVELPADVREIIATWRALEEAAPILEATELYEDLHGGADPDDIEPVQLELPRAITAMGLLEAVEYRADRGDGEHTYRHEFEGELPTLAVTPEDRRLVIVKGSYTVTPAGIEG